ncbi:MAG: anhydro-N-acetylmuramic acid kinase [Planctomycetota bacterium]
MRGIPSSEPRYILGLNSGTSADAVDLALIRVTGEGQERVVEKLSAAAAQFPEKLQQAIHMASAWQLADVARFDYALGAFFGRCAATFLERIDFPIDHLTCVASHGQTVYHHSGEPMDGSMQLGDLSVLAHTVGADVVGNFRTADLAGGGQGAPISPFADWVLHGGSGVERVILNLGGICNITLLPKSGPPTAWDSGPANGPLDVLMRAEANQEMDLGGALAASGTVLGDLLATLKKDAYFEQAAPKSTGLEKFGAALAQKTRNLAPQAELCDILATLAELVGWSIGESLKAAGWQGGAVYVAGGGLHNSALQAALNRHLGATRVHSYAELGWEPDAREAVAFALLGDAFLLQEPSTWLSTTGCRQQCVLGQWSPGPLLDPT